MWIEMFPVSVVAPNVTLFGGIHPDVIWNIYFPCGTVIKHCSFVDVNCLSAVASQLLVKLATV